MGYVSTCRLLTTPDRRSAHVGSPDEEVPAVGGGSAERVLRTYLDSQAHSSIREEVGRTITSMAEARSGAWLRHAEERRRIRVLLTFSRLRWELTSHGRRTETKLQVRNVIPGV